MAVSYFCFRGLWADEMLARQMRDPSSIWAVAAPRAPSGLFSARGDGFPPGRGWGRIRHEETPEEMAVCV